MEASIYQSHVFNYTETFQGKMFSGTGRQFGETRQIVMGYDVTWFDEYMPVCTGMSATIPFRQGEVVENA